jgi:hypothetical protein
MIENHITPKPEPEVRRANGRRYAALCNKAVHAAPWVKGDRTIQGGIYIALELAQKAYEAHGLPYEKGLSNMHRYDPRRFTWFCDDAGDAANCLKVRDDKTGRIVVWPHF